MFKSILVLEDDPCTATLIKMLIEEKGYHVVLAKDGTEAFEKLEQMNNVHRPCLILCDLQMAPMTGWEFVEKAGDGNKVLSIPLVFHTSETITPPGFKALHKPVDRESLFAIVKEHCGEPT